MWQIRRVRETGSTNVDVAALARDGAAEGTVLVTEYQSAGRGRLDRTWEAPAGSSLTASFLLRPTDVPVARWPWLPLLAGVAAVEALAELGVSDAGVKWPNDVLIGEHKLAGILVERVDTPTGSAAIAGVGLNVLQGRNQLPPTATSLRLHGAADVGPDDVLTALCDRLAEHYTAWRSSAGDPAGGLGVAYRRHCVTLGRYVRAELPAGTMTEGRAVDVDDSGRLVLDTGSGRLPVGAGDIVHLRAI